MSTSVSGLIQCPSCSHNVSRTAPSCPSCGAVLRKPRRSIFGKAILALFWLFNAFMVWSIFIGTKGAVTATQSLQGAEKVGGQIGASIGITVLLVIWMLGVVILGMMALLTRARS
jgi:uncharacterized paraquat-inducible protein A